MNALSRDGFNHPIQAFSPDPEKCSNQFVEPDTPFTLDYADDSRDMAVQYCVVAKTPTPEPIGYILLNQNQETAFPLFDREKNGLVLNEQIDSVTFIAATPTNLYLWRN